MKVFYDLFEEADLWGKDLYARLSDVYQRRARFTVMFISAKYAEKLWTNHERRAAQARAFQEAQEYILPARFDETDIPGVLPTVGYVSLVGRSPEELASLIAKKLVGAGGSVPTELVRRDFSISRKTADVDPTELSVHVVDDKDSAISGATVTAQAENGTTIEAMTNDEGRAVLQIATRRSYRLLIAHSQFPAAIVDDVDPAEGIQVTLPRSENLGSVIIHSTGCIPGLSGRLNPILDTSHRMYMYADNIAIDGGKPQPANFAINEPVELEDAQGKVVYATIKHIAARTALIQFTRL